MNLFSSEDRANTKKQNFKITLKYVKGLLEEVHFNVQASVNTSGFQTCFKSDEC